MSTIKALRILVDNLRFEIQKLQVENTRLKTQVEDNVSESSEGTSALMEELHQRLHEAQEREVNSEQ